MICKRATVSSLTLAIALATTLGVGPLHAQEVREISRTCLLYHTLAQEPTLDDYPVVVGRTMLGTVTLLTPAIAGPGRGRLFFGKRMPTLEQAKDNLNRQQLARTVIEALPGIWDVTLKFDHSYTDEELLEKRHHGYEANCRARLVLDGGPRGAEVWVDDALRGRLPVEIEIGAGTREVVIAHPRHSAWQTSLVIEPGETRRITAALDPLARIDLSSIPAGAAVIVDGTVAGHTPLTYYAESGEHDVRLTLPGHDDMAFEVEAEIGEQLTLAQSLAPSAAVCPAWPVTGSLKQGAQRLASMLRGERLTPRVPLHLVISSTMESKLPVTHVVDGRHILFDARRGDHYEQRPEGLLGRELRGLSFGEVGVEVLTPPPGPVTVTRVEAKRNTLIVGVRHDDGTDNAVYVDFAKPAKQVTITEAVDALCWVFRAPSSTASGP